MKPFRSHVAIAIDGGGIRGIVPTRALAMVEEHLGQPVPSWCHLAAGTSTGSIVSAGIAAGLSADQMYRLYRELGAQVFPRTLRRLLWPLTRYRYSPARLTSLLRHFLGDSSLGEVWGRPCPIDLVITAFDLVENRTRFIKPWKAEYAGWPLVQAVLASSSAPTYFPPVAGRYVDGGVGSYANPCYLAAYEARFCLNWEPQRTTLISLGTGREPHRLGEGDADRFYAWEWLGPLLGAFGQSADDQQVHLVETFFDGLDFRRFQVDLSEPIAMDDAGKVEKLAGYGEELGRMILEDQVDRAMSVGATPAPRRCRRNHDNG